MISFLRVTHERHLFKKIIAFVSIILINQKYQRNMCVGKTTTHFHQEKLYRAPADR